MPYCRDCGTYISGSATYCYDCENDIIDRSRRTISNADEDEKRRIRNDRNYAHDWLQDIIGWIVALWGIISKIYTGGSCYITSAVVKYKGLPDNSEPMEKFRAFRKEFILDSNDERLKDELQEYYLLGAFIINWASSRADSNLIWEYISNYVFEFLNLIEKHKYKDAYQYFKSHTLQLRNDIMLSKHINFKNCT